MHGNSEGVCLKLHENVIASCAAVCTERCELRTAFTLHRIEHIGHLHRDRVESSTRKMCSTMVMP